MTPDQRGKRYDGYIRVSRVGDREGESFISPSDQREKIETWAQSRGVRITEWHEDLDQTGGKLSRPGLDALMQRIRRGETDGVAVARLDRLSRAGVADALRLVEEIREHGAQLAALDLDIDPTTTFGELALTIMLALARMERRRITESWDTANRRAIERGIHFSARTPYGYRRREDKRLEPDPETAPVVAEMFERRAAKQSRWSIAKWMNAEHPREDGRDWTARNIEVILANPVYLGEAFHGKHRNPDAHPPIIGRSQFDAAASVTGGVGRIDGQNSALLAGLIRCAGCRYAMRRTFTRYRKGDRRHVYSCQRKHSGGICKEPANVVAHLIEPLVVVNTLALIGDARWSDEVPDEEALRAAALKLEQATASRDTFLSDDELRARIERKAFLSQAEARQAAVDQAQAAYDDELRRHQAASRREHVLVNDFFDWPRERQAETLRTALDAVYVRKGRTPLDGRAMILLDGADEFERPVRGGTDYEAKPIPWPTKPGDPKSAYVPALAVEMGAPHAIEARDVLAQARELTAD